MLSLFPVTCSKFGASSLKAEVSATDVKTLISAALLATAANKNDINPPAAISAMRFAKDVWIMHPSDEDKFQLFGHLVGAGEYFAFVGRIGTEIAHHRHCCARAASGHATTVLVKRLMNSRRLTGSTPVAENHLRESLIRSSTEG